MATKKMRHMVSLKKKRFQEDGFDLDLTYITDRIIAFGFPSEGRESMYRNPMEEVQRFFETRHKDHYWIYNLCAEPERQYKAKRFHDRLSCFPFYDHNAPPLNLIPEFVRHCENWMMEDVKNVVGIHCKAGKGRTGVMICCLLLYLKKYGDPLEAMKFYGNQRTHNGAGVTIPSQRRYIHYYFRTIQDGMQPDRLMFIKSISVINGTPWEGHTIFITVECNGIETYNSKKKAKFVKKDNRLELGPVTIPVCGNCKVILYRDERKGRMCWFWFHTGYITSSEFKLEKKEIDKAVGDKQHKVYPEDFSIEAHFTTDGKEWKEAEAAFESAKTHNNGEAAEEDDEDAKVMPEEESDSESDEEEEEELENEGVTESSITLANGSKSIDERKEEKKEKKSKSEKKESKEKSGEKKEKVEKKEKSSKKDASEGTPSTKKKRGHHHHHHQSKEGEKEEDGHGHSKEENHDGEKKKKKSKEGHGKKKPEEESSSKKSEEEKAQEASA